MRSRALTLAAVLLALIGAGLALPGTPARAADPVPYVSSTGNDLLGSARSLQLPHATNARDIGGFRTTDGHVVKTGIAFRSNKLGDLDDGEWATLRGLGVNHVVDLRNASEKSEAPDDVPAGVGYQEADVVGIPPTGTPQLSDLTATLHCLAPGTPVGAVSILAALKDFSDVGTAEGYLLEACYGGSMIAFRDLLHSLQDPAKTVVFHCSAGKDRTGVATAILLTLLGVDRTTVLDDFENSNHFRGAGSVQRDWLEQWFTAVDLDWGSFDNFARNGLGLSYGDIAALKKRFLANAAAPVIPEVAPPAGDWDRMLGLEHASNARDAGGYQTADGLWVRTGAAFRSNALGDLTAAEWQKVRDLGVTRIIDLRTSAERSQKPDNPPADIAWEADSVLDPSTTVDPADLTGYGQCGAKLAVLQTLATAIGGSDPDPESAVTAATYPVMACSRGATESLSRALHALATPGETVLSTAPQARTGPGSPRPSCSRSSASRAQRWSLTTCSPTGTTRPRSVVTRSRPLGCRPGSTRSTRSTGTSTPTCPRG